MGTVLQFKVSGPRRSAMRDRETKPSGEIVIFPGIRIERHELDLSHRLRPSAGRGEFDNIIGWSRPRKSV